MKKTLTILLLTIVLCPFALAQICDENTTKTTPDDRFTIHNNGTLTDKTTGLIWMRCSVGQTWDNNTAICLNDAEAYTWSEAIIIADTLDFAGKKDWRVPNIKALKSIVELACDFPAINETLFPQSVSSGYWSSSQGANNNSYAWNVYFSYGFDYNNDKDDSKYVRLVHDGQ